MCEEEKYEVVERKTTGLAGLGTIEEMKANIKAMEERRSVVVEYIDANFEKGIDFGPTDDRSDKPTLKKPGGEKICRLFNTHPTWKRDDETWEMLGKPGNVVCYICYIVDNATGNIIGEGRGAETVGNKGRDANKTIKNAEKCALVDSALFTFALSEKFTQDDGGRQRSLTASKENFNIEIANARMGEQSELTDTQFIIKILLAELHKKRIDTAGELIHLRKVLFEQKLYDFATGEKNA